MPKKSLRNRNEMAFPPAPAVIRAIRNFDMARSGFYFDGYYGSLLAPELARRFRLPLSQVSVGYGMEFFLRALFDSCGPENDIVLTNAPHYGFYAAYAKAKGIRLETFRLIDRGERFEFDIDDCLKKMRALKPKIILITSPNNPTGNSIALADLKKILTAANREALVVLDEAYAGFHADYDEKAIISLVRRFGNFVVLRSFSKRYGLAGLRIGFAVWGKRAKELIRYDGLYLGGSRLLESAALAALNSELYYRRLSRKIMDERKRFSSTVNRLKYFKAYASDANFVLVKVDDRRARARLEHELARLPAAISKFVMPEFMRVSLGSPQDTRRFLHALERADAHL